MTPRGQFVTIRRHGPGQCVTLYPVNSHALVPHGHQGISAFTGAGDPLLITRGDGYVTTAQLASIFHVDPATIRQWKHRKWITPRGLDERGGLLWDPDEGAAAEKIVRANGLRTSGVDPRTQRRAA